MGKIVVVRFFLSGIYNVVTTLAPSFLIGPSSFLPVTRATGNA